MKKRIFALALAATMVLSAVGCGQTAEETNDSAAAASETAEEVTEETTEGGGELVIYSPNSEGLINATIHQ